MIIDSHTHVQRVSGFWDSPPERIISLMEEAGIDISVIMTYSDSPELLRYIRESVRKFPKRLIGYARLDPSCEDAEGLLKKAVEEWGFKGLKLHPVGNHVHPAHPASLKLIETASQLGVPTLFHCGDEEYTMPLQIIAAARAVPSAIIILGHMGGYFHVNDAIIAAQKCENIYLETSAMPYPHLIAKAVNRIGSKRILFASDGPGCPPDLELEKIRLAKLDNKDEENLLFRNIRKILSI